MFGFAEAFSSLPSMALDGKPVRYRSGCTCKRTVVSSSIDLDSAGRANHQFLRPSSLRHFARNWLPAIARQNGNLTQNQARTTDRCLSICSSHGIQVFGQPQPSSGKLHNHASPIQAKQSLSRIMNCRSVRSYLACSAPLLRQ